MPIEDWISDPIASERYEQVVETSAESAIELAFQVPLGADPVVRALLRARGLNLGNSMLDFMDANQLFFLQREPREAVIGLGRPVWTPLGGDSGERLTDPAAWESWNEPHSFKAVTTLSAEPLGEERSKLVTQTQVVATDEWGRRAFHLYWLAVGSFSGLFRRRWLRAVAEVASAI